MNAMPMVIVALVTFALAYRFYFGFVVAKVAVIEDQRCAPSRRLYDSQNYHPMSKLVLFGHHFAAIAGAGPLVGPVLAAQFGYFPGFAWMLVGAVFAGSVHDLIILTASVRHDGKSLAEIARREISKVSGGTASMATLIIIIVALAGLGSVVVNALAESSWGTFTIAATIPIALFMGLWMFQFRKGRTGEATIIGVVLLTLAVIYGRNISQSAYAGWFTFDKKTLTLLLAGYGFFASALPVWLLLSPRDYLSTIMKLAVIGVLAVGVIVVAPDLKMPAFTGYINGGGPLIKGTGTLFPYLFITIACGAISGFHALVSSGTTPKMVMRESHLKSIAVGSMLAEGMVSVLALIAACSLEPADYFMINCKDVEAAHVLRTQFPTATPEEFKAELGRLRVREKDQATFLQALDKPAPAFVANIPDIKQARINIQKLSAEVEEQVMGRPGGAVSLAVGMAQIFSAVPGLTGLMSYWYHFAIMFEALFILTTIDAGTRIARFILQEAMGKVYKPFAHANWLPGNILASFLVVLAWGYFIYTGNVDTIWPMFGAANQMLACVALAIGTSFIFNRGRGKYAWVTILPMVFVGVTTLRAGYFNIVSIYVPQLSNPAQQSNGIISLVLTCLCMISVLIILADAIPKWIAAARGKPVYTDPPPGLLSSPAGAPVDPSLPESIPD